MMHLKLSVALLFSIALSLSAATSGVLAQSSRPTLAETLDRIEAFPDKSFTFTGAGNRYITHQWRLESTQGCNVTIRYIMVSQEGLALADRWAFNLKDVTDLEPWDRTNMPFNPGVQLTTRADAIKTTNMMPTDSGERGSGSSINLAMPTPAAEARLINALTSAVKACGGKL